MADRACGYDHCDAVALLYACGPRCARHAPWAEAGRSWHTTFVDGSPYRVDLLPAWWVRLDGTVVPPMPISTSSLYDHRAVSSGRRVPGWRRRAARAAEAHEDEFVAVV